MPARTALGAGRNNSQDVAAVSRIPGSEAPESPGKAVLAPLGGAETRGRSPGGG